MGFPLPDTGSVTEDVGVVGGFLTATGDADFGPFFNNENGGWNAGTYAGSYNSQLVIDANGVWTYTADNSHPTIQALDTGQSITEVFVIGTSLWPTTITITINGTDEPPCFVAGTMIDTPQGERAIEDLGVGDEVLTRDNGVQTVRWIGSTTVETGGANDKLSPIRLSKDALAPGVPSQDILLSPMHRILVDGPNTDLLFGEDEVFCAVKHLVNGHTIRREVGDSVEYVHMLFDDHQVVTSSGCASESFFPGNVGLNGFDRDAQDELFLLFPELASLPGSYGRTARTVLKRFEAQILRDRLMPEIPFLRATTPLAEAA